MTQPVWNTKAGSLGNYPTDITISIPISATATSPGTSIVAYTLISGSLPTGVELSSVLVGSVGFIVGTPSVVYIDTTNTFTIRAIDNLGNIRDRTFSMGVSGTAYPSFITPEGNILNRVDSTWINYLIEYSNNNPNYAVRVELAQGTIPPGLELSSDGTIQGYASPPVTGNDVPTIKTYPFVLSLTTELNGTVVSVAYGSYSITISNQQLTNPPNTRPPVLLNSQPLTTTPTSSDPYYGYYIPVGTNFIGTYQSDNYLAFKIIGYDFDGDILNYLFSDLPLGLTADYNTGWISGTPILNSDSISQYSFNVGVVKASNPDIGSGYSTFTFNVAKNVADIITWITTSDLGTVYNGSISTLSVLAKASVPLEYRLISGKLPPNTALLSSGEITGRIAQQPGTVEKPLGDTTEFNIEIEAYSPEFPLLTNTRTFTITVLQQYPQPYETLYIQAATSLKDRNIIRTLLDNTTLIPDEVLYRPYDTYFGKATNVIYDHAYGIYASNLAQYLTTITRNHYWRNITLGELKTAVAKNANGDIIYEVVYSEVIDDLINPKGVSIPSSIIWSRPINLNQGPWYSSMTDIFTSYVFEKNDKPTYYTSLDPGSVTTLYPNSLYNMRTRVADILGQELDSGLLPSWMTSQQPNGGTLGYTQAWVIAYCKPGTELTTTATATSTDTNEISVSSTSGFVIGRPITFDGITFGNINTDTIYYVKEVTSSTTFKISSTKALLKEFALSTGSGIMTAVLPITSYSEIVKNNIETQWNHTLNEINFEIDRFTVDKSTTYNWESITQIWDSYPSADPTPDPLNSDDFYVLFPRQTILPKQS